MLDQDEQQPTPPSHEHGGVQTSSPALKAILCLPAQQAGDRIGAKQLQ